MDLEKFKAYVIDRLDEASTWQGVGFLFVLFGAKWAADLDWGQAAGLGGIISAAIKLIFPDKKPAVETEQE